VTAMSLRTVTELRLRHAQLTDTAQRLRDRSLVVDPTRPASAALSREVRQTQLRADDYGRLLRILDGPTLEEMEAGVLDAVDGMRCQTDDPVSDSAVEEINRLVRELFAGWRTL
jgi:hypothetical protein